MQAPQLSSRLPLEAPNRAVGNVGLALLCVALLLGAAPRLSAQDSSQIQKELTELRQAVQALRAEVEAARAAGASATTRVQELQALLGEQEGAAVEKEIAAGTARISGWGGKKSPISIGGYFDAEFRSDHAGNQKDAFDQHRLVLQMQSDIAGPVSFRSEIEFEGGGYISGTTSNYLTGNQVLIEFAEAHIALSDAANVKVGSLLVPFNRFNYEHDAPLQELTDRPLVDRRVIPTTWNDSGIGVYGAFHPDFATIDYDVVLINGLTEKISARDGTRNSRASFRKDNNDNKTIAGRVGASFDLTWLDAAAFGVSALCGKYDDENQQTATMLGFDWKLRRGAFELVGEYAKLNLERGPGEVGASPQVPGGMDGWYAELRYRFFPEDWRGGALFGPRSTFTIIARYDSVDSDTGAFAVDYAANGDAYRDDRRRVTLGVNFRPTPQSVIKFEYQWLPEHGGLAQVDNDRIVASFATYF